MAAGPRPMPLQSIQRVADCISDPEVSQQLNTAVEKLIASLSRHRRWFLHHLILIREVGAANMHCTFSKDEPRPQHMKKTIFDSDSLTHQDKQDLLFGTGESRAEHVRIIEAAAHMITDNTTEDAVGLRSQVLRDIAEIRAALEEGSTYEQYTIAMTHENIRANMRSAEFAQQRWQDGRAA